MEEEMYLFIRRRAAATKNIKRGDAECAEILFEFKLVKKEIKL